MGINSGPCGGGGGSYLDQGGNLSEIELLTSALLPYHALMVPLEEALEVRR
jgi:hypothetical protein